MKIIVNALQEPVRQIAKNAGVDGSVVLENVPAGSTVVGVPGRVVKRINPDHPQDELDQIHYPDPVWEAITSLQHSNAEITNQLIDLEQKMRTSERAQKKQSQNAE